MKRIPLAVVATALTAITSATLLFTAPSLAITSATCSFGSTDNVSNVVAIETTPTYNWWASVPSFEVEYFDANGALVSSAKETGFIPAPIRQVTTGSYTYSLDFDGVTELKRNYAIQPSKLKSRIVRGDYYYSVIQNLSSDQTGHDVIASATYNSPTSASVSLP